LAPGATTSRFTPPDPRSQLHVNHVTLGDEPGVFGVGHLAGGGGGASAPLITEDSLGRAVAGFSQRLNLRVLGYERGCRGGVLAAQTASTVANRDVHRGTGRKG